MAKRRGRRGAGAEPKLVRPTAVDRHVGSRVRVRREMLGFSQTKLATKLGITFQQLQKNEKGVNRIAASRLYELSDALNVPIQWFFDEMPPEVAASGQRRKDTTAIHKPAVDAELLAASETLKLVRAYYRIEDSAIRARVRTLAKSLADENH